MSTASTANMTLRIDHENNAETWWDAARALAAADDSRGAEVFRRLDRANGSDISVLAEEAAEFGEWASRLPGFDHGPAYAPHPYLVLQDDGDACPQRRRRTHTARPGTAAAGSGR